MIYLLILRSQTAWHTLSVSLFVTVCAHACVHLAHPVEKVFAPSCCPGASTWHTAKCCMISAMSSWSKSVFQQVLSGKQWKDGGVGWVVLNREGKKNSNSLNRWANLRFGGAVSNHLTKSDFITKKKKKEIMEDSTRSLHTSSYSYTNMTEPKMIAWIQGL